MQPLPTEAGPRSVCAQCGEPLPPPNGSATFVYGVGPVGYQSCAACGAKWRYLWQDQPPPRVKPERSRRMLLLFGGLVVTALLVVGGVAFARSKPWKDDTSRPRSPASTPATTGAPGAPAGRVDPRVAIAYVGIADPMNKARAGFLPWLVNVAPGSPQYEVNAKTGSYIDAAQSDIDKLEAVRWPTEIAGSVDALLNADKKFVDDLDNLRYGQQRSPSYVGRLVEEAGAVQAADNAVRQQLGL